MKYTLTDEQKTNFVLEYVDYLNQLCTSNPVLGAASYNITTLPNQQNKRTEYILTETYRNKILKKFVKTEVKFYLVYEDFELKYVPLSAVSHPLIAKIADNMQYYLYMYKLFGENYKNDLINYFNNKRESELKAVKQNFEKVVKIQTAIMAYNRNVTEINLRYKKLFNSINNL